jgi:uncharacterized protein (TIGR02246 family)
MGGKLHYWPRGNKFVIRSFAGSRKSVPDTARSSKMPEDISIEEAEIAQLFQKWNSALLSGKVENVVDLYAQDAILIPTLMNEVLCAPAAITAYFANLMHRKPSSKILSAHIRHFGHFAIHSGSYEIALAADGPESKLQARFTFVYRKDPTGWKIIEHHSSMLPKT